MKNGRQYARTISEKRAPVEPKVLRPFHELFNRMNQAEAKQSASGSSRPVRL